MERFFGKVSTDELKKERDEQDKEFAKLFKDPRKKEGGGQEEVKKKEEEEEKIPAAVPLPGVFVFADHCPCDPAPPLPVLSTIEKLRDLSIVRDNICSIEEYALEHHAGVFTKSYRELLANDIDQGLNKPEAQAAIVVANAYVALMEAFEDLLHYQIHPDTLIGCSIDWRKVGKAHDDAEQSLLWFTPAVTVEIESFERKKKKKTQASPPPSPIREGKSEIKKDDFEFTPYKTKKDNEEEEKEGNKKLRTKMEEAAMSRIEARLEHVTKMVETQEKSEEPSPALREEFFEELIKEGIRGIIRKKEEATKGESTNALIVDCIKDIQKAIDVEFESHS